MKRFLKSKVKNSQRWHLLGRTSRRFFLLFLLFIFAVVYLHLSMFFILLLYLHLFSRLPLPCHRHFLLVSQAREGLHQLLALPQLLFSAFSFSSTASATVLRGHFLTTGVFYLTLLADIFGTSQHFRATCFYQGFPGSRHLFLEICRTSYWFSEHRPSPSICLIHSNPQSFIYLKFVFINVNIAKVLLVVKTLVRSSAKLFSNHEIIKQQPN